MDDRTIVVTLLTLYLSLPHVHMNCSTISEFCICFEDGIVQCIDTNFTDLTFLREVRNRSRLNEIIIYHNNIPKLQNQIFQSLQLSSVRTIRLPYNGIRTIEHRAFHGLRKLKKLILVRNNIRTLQPDTFQNCSKLILLDLSNNQISDINALRDIPSLEDCRLSSNSITELFDQSFCTSSTCNLKTLGLGKNELTTISSQAFSGLTLLEQLNLSENKITSLHRDTFNSTTQLTELDLSYNKLTNLNFVKVIPSLKYLVLKNNRIESVGNGTFFSAQIPSLVHIDLSNNIISSVEKLAFLGLQNLWTLNLSSNKIEFIYPGTFRNTTNLRFLDLKGNYISELHFSHDIMMLWNLDVSNNQVTTIRTETFFNPNITQLTNSTETNHTIKFILARTITHINLANNRISTIESGALEGLFKLFHLDLSGNNISEISRDLFCMNTQLNKLSIRNNSLADLSFIPSATNLEFCDVSYNNIQTFVNPAIFSSEPLKLRYLYMTHSNITYLDRSHFSKYTNLVFLNVSNNRLRSLSFVSSIKSLEHLFISNNLIPSLTNGIFGNMVTSKLRTLDISKNCISTVGRRAFEKLSNVIVINMSFNNISFLYDDTFMPAIRLKDLNLRSNRLTDIAFISNIHNLKMVDLSNNYITMLKKQAFTNSHNINIINLANNFITEIEDGIFQNMQQLHYLNLRSNNIVHIPDGTFTNTTKINTLNLSRNNLLNVNYLSSILTNQMSKTPNDVSSDSLLSQMNRIDISYNRITDIGVMAFQTLLQMQELNLAGNNISYLDPDTFQYCASLLKLDVSSNRFSESTAIPNAPHLKHLYLHNNTFHLLSNITFSHTRLSQLVHVNLSKNHISSIEVGAFHNLRLLKYLDLSKNNISFIHEDLFQVNTLLSVLDISENCIQHIGNYLVRAPSLKYFDASDNMISSISGDIFSDQLEYIDLSNNIISQIDFQTFNNLSKLQFIDLYNSTVPELQDVRGFPLFDTEENFVHNSCDRTCVEGNKMKFNMYEASLNELKKFARLYVWIFQMNMRIT